MIKKRWEVQTTLDIARMCLLHPDILKGSNFLSSELQDDKFVSVYATEFVMTPSSSKKRKLIELITSLFLC